MITIYFPQTWNLERCRLWTAERFEDWYVFGDFGKAFLAKIMVLDL